LVELIHTVVIPSISTTHPQSTPYFSLKIVQLCVAISVGANAEKIAIKTLHNVSVTEPLGLKDADEL